MLEAPRVHRPHLDRRVPVWERKPDGDEKVACMEAGGAMRGRRGRGGTLVAPGDRHNHRHDNATVRSQKQSDGGLDVCWKKSGSFGRS